MANYKRINGLQHIGVAVSDMDRSLPFYRKFFGLNIPFFDSVQPAPLMDVYTRNATITKRASMVMNLQGGCALEVIQPTSCKPQPCAFEVCPGDFGIVITQIKCADVLAAHRQCKLLGAPAITRVYNTEQWGQTFYMTDLDENRWQFVQSDEWYTKGKHFSGGVAGCTIGVSDMSTAMALYSGLLGYDRVLSDQSGVFDDWSELPQGNKEYRRVKLTQGNRPGGGFAKVMGATTIELVHDLSGSGRFIFQDRIWGDIGFAHVGFDVKGMTQLGKDLGNAGYPFTCDSRSVLNMGNTKVHCTYIHDKDRTLLELIEVYKVPIMEKWGLYLNVEKRDPMKPLPDFMLKALRFSRIKED